jgi:tetratricopeptide (TPR) repeat protein
MPPASRPGLVSGISEAFYDMAELLLDADHPDIALFYAQTAAYLAPAAPDIHFLLGEIEQAQGRYGSAAADFMAGPNRSSFAFLARLDAVSDFELAGNRAMAARVAQDLIKSYPAMAEPRIALGDLMRREQRYADAAAAYTAALTRMRADDSRRAAVLFTRGVSHDEVKQEDAAETDLTQAAALAPDQPLILNYLGYRWANEGRNLEQAEALLQHAYKLAPNDAAIADSLGWAMYRMGKYEDAIVKLEEAVQGKPGDSVLNGHLGDAYWQAGRKTEARFQWHHALINASGEDATTLKDKLRQGLAPPAPLGENHAEALPSER